MMSVIQRIQTRLQPIVRHVETGDPRRAAAEDFVRGIFLRRYGAQVADFAPNLMLLKQDSRIVAAVGWRPAQNGTLMLERYLDEPIEQAVSRLAGQPVPRERIAEVGHLAAERAGGSAAVILELAAHLDAFGFEWATFTATAELIGIFRRLELPPLALAAADPRRLGAQAQIWGSYYDTHPVVVAGRLRLALDKEGCRG